MDIRGKEFISTDRRFHIRIIAPNHVINQPGDYRVCGVPIDLPLTDSINGSVTKESLSSNFFFKTKLAQVLYGS